MLLKRLYTREGNKLTVTGIKVLRAGPTWHLTPDTLAKGILQGWIAQQGNKITLLDKEEAVSYKIVRLPGYYCCHCRVSLDDSESARLHLGTEHKGEKSPDSSNPSGYERINYYDCVKE